MFQIDFRFSSYKQQSETIIRDMPKLLQYRTKLFRLWSSQVIATRTTQKQSDSAVVIPGAARIQVVVLERPFRFATMPGRFSARSFTRPQRLRLFSATRTRLPPTS